MTLVAAGTRHNGNYVRGIHLGFPQYPTMIGCSRDLSDDPPSLTCAVETLEVYLNRVDLFHSIFCNKLNQFWFQFAFKLDFSIILVEVYDSHTYFYFHIISF